MNCFLKMCAILLFVFTVEQNIDANMDISALEKNDEYSSMVTMALFEKLNWMIKEIRSVYQESREISRRLEEYKRRLNIYAFKHDIRELLTQQSIKTENMLLHMQHEVLENLDLQKNLLKNTSLDVDNFKSFDVASFKRNRNWQTILRRQDGSQNFNRSWNEYKTGFGHENGEFFIGLEALHAMTTYADPQELLIVLKDFDNQTRYAKYSDFVIGSESEKYNIKKIGIYQGDADDSLSQHLYCKFSTYDQDNDNSTASNCALLYQGGWWFSSCYNSHLTGRYLHQPKFNKEKEKGLVWYSWHGLEYSLKYAEMMIRPK